MCERCSLLLFVVLVSPIFTLGYKSQIEILLFVTKRYIPTIENISQNLHAEILNKCLWETYLLMSNWIPPCNVAHYCIDSEDMRMYVFTFLNAIYSAQIHRSVEFAQH